MTAIVVDDLRKSYGSVEAVRGVSFNVEEGEVFGLLGPNGAGKTTTIEILEGYRHRDAGTVTVLGVDPQVGGRKLRERVGLVLQEAAVPPMLSVRELVELYRGFYPAPRPADAQLVPRHGARRNFGRDGLESHANRRLLPLYQSSGGHYDDGRAEHWSRRRSLLLKLVGFPWTPHISQSTPAPPAAFLRRSSWSRPFRCGQ